MISEGYPFGIILIHAVVAIFQDGQQWKHHTNIALNNGVKGMVIIYLNNGVNGMVIIYLHCLGNHMQGSPDFTQISFYDQKIKITLKWLPK